MPPKKPSRGSRAKRQPPRRPVRPTSVAAAQDEFDSNDDARAFVAPAASRARMPTPARSPSSTRIRSRAPAQIVIANYDFLRHDLRVLGMLAPSLVIVMVILSFVVH